MNHNGARGNCAAIDTGSTHLVIGDVARVHGLTVAEAETMVSRGREKLRRWLAMLDAVDEADEGGARLSQQDAARATNLGRVWPIEKMARMTPNRWRAALAEARK